MKIKLSISVSGKLGFEISCNLVDWPEVPRLGDSIDLHGFPVTDFVTVKNRYFLPSRGQIIIYATTSPEGFRQLGIHSSPGTMDGYRVIPDVPWIATTE